MPFVIHNFLVMVANKESYIEIEASGHFLKSLKTLHLQDWMKMLAAVGQPVPDIPHVSRITRWRVVTIFNLSSGLPVNPVCHQKY